MKTIALAFCTSLMLCTLATAQQPASTPSTQPAQPVQENYVVTLSVAEKTQNVAEISFVTTSGEFKEAFPYYPSDNVTTFGGKLVSGEGDTVFISYTLAGKVPLSGSTGNTQYGTLMTQALVRFKPGESIQIFKSEACTYTLNISRHSGQAATNK